MADRELTINLTLKKNLAETASKEFHAAEAKRITKSLTSHEVAEKAKTAIVKRENAQRVQAVVNAHKTTIDLSKDAADKRKRADADATRARIAGDKAINAALRQTSQDEIRLARETAREHKRLDNEWKARLKANAKEARAERKLQALEEKAWSKEAANGWEAQATAITSATASVASFGLGLAGLNSVSAIIGEMEAGFQRTRDSVFNATELLHDFRETLLELAALKDRAGDTSAEMMDVFKLQAKTGQKTEDVKAFQTAYHGAAEAFIGKKIAPDQAKIAEEGVGSLQAVIGGNPEAYADLTALLFQTMKGKNGAMLQGGDVVSEVGAMEQLARPGKLSFTDTADQFGKAAPYVDAGVVTGRQAMGLTAAYSLTDKKEAGTRVDQLVRATVGSLVRDRTGKIQPLEGTDQESTAAYLKGAGAKVGMDPIQIARLVSADVAAAEKKAKAEGKDFSRYAYLQTKGYGNQTDLKALVGATNFLENGTWDKFQGMIDDPNLGKGRQAEIETKKRTEVVFQGRMARAASERAKMVAGMGVPETMRALREGEYAVMRAKDPSLPEFKELEERGPNAFGEIMRGQKNSVDQAVERSIMKEAQKRHIPFKHTADWVHGNGANGQQAWHMAEAEQFRVQRLLKADGWDPAGDANQRVNNIAQGKLEDAGMIEAAKDLKAAAKDIRAAAQPPRAPAMRGKPNQPPAFPYGGTIY